MPESDATRRGGNAAYHLRRAAQERAAAAAAVDPSVRRIHLRLAEHHAAKARSPAIEGAKALQPTPPGRVIPDIAGEADW